MGFPSSVQIWTISGVAILRWKKNTNQEQENITAKLKGKMIRLKLRERQGTSSFRQQKQNVGINLLFLD